MDCFKKAVCSASRPIDEEEAPFPEKVCSPCMAIHSGEEKTARVEQEDADGADAPREFPWADAPSTWKYTCSVAPSRHQPRVKSRRSTAAFKSNPLDLLFSNGVG